MLLSTVKQGGNGDPVTMEISYIIYMSDNRQRRSVDRCLKGRKGRQRLFYTTVLYSDIVQTTVKGK